MSHPRIEEVSDSDPDVISDPEEMDLDDFADADIMRRRDQPASKKQQQQQQPSASSQPSAAATAAAKQHILNPGNAPQPGGGGPAPRQMTADDRAAYADYQCLYPVYFDANRSRAQGRRISASLAVRNPLAREIANACSRLRLQTVLEPEKTHPKDWSNPGRVKVALKRGKSSSGAGGGGGGLANVNNKHHLYLLIAQHLRENPTTEKSAGLRMRIGGQIQPPEDEPYPKPAVPRGWKMNEFVPYLSSAMTGGGVSENLFGDIMKGMQGGQDPMAALMGGAAGGGSGAGSGNASGAEEGGKKKKDKKKGKA